MGMYNEVFKKCPHCPNGVGYMQIAQVVLGFGGFNLDDPSTLEDLSMQELKLLKDRIHDDTFSCRHQDGSWAHEGDDEDVCGLSFRVLDEKEKDERERLIREITGNQ
jgi:hypothetical protein